MPAADRRRSRAGLRACSVKLLRREADLRLDQSGIEAHAVGVRIDVGAGVLQHRARLGVQEIDADLLQHASAPPDGSTSSSSAETSSTGGNGDRGCGWAAPEPAAALGPGAPAARSSWGADIHASPHIGRSRWPRPALRSPANLAPAGNRTAHMRSFRRSPGRYSPRAAWPRRRRVPARAGGPAPPANRAISQERNNATASLLRSSGWVVR